MRGKKIDKKFISSFIEKSLSKEGTFFTDIVNMVHKELDEIDKKIIEAEELKKRRSKLLDVKEFLEKNHET